MNKATALLLALFLSLAACGSDVEPESLEGVWMTADDAAVQMTAEIIDGDIIIDWTMEDISALYWMGSAPDEATDGDSFTSNGNTAQMDASLLGSGDPTKEFRYEDGKISFELTVVGVTQRIYLERTGNA